MISTAQVERVAGFVDRAKAAGAKVVAGGYRPEIPGLPDGAFYRPTLLTNVAQDSEVVQQEIFGLLCQDGPGTLVAVGDLREDHVLE